MNGDLFGNGAGTCVGGSAEFTACGRHRLFLTRVWDVSKPVMGIAAANPSKAGWPEGDQTIAKGVGFATRHGFGALHMLNLESRVATDPAELAVLHADERSVRENDWRLIATLYQAQARHLTLVCAWGDLPPAAAVERFELWALKIGAPLWCFGQTKGGAPRHLSRLGYDAEPVMFNARAHGLRFGGNAAFPQAVVA